MECKHAQLAIQAALDAGRIAQPPQAIREHLRACADCRRAWDEYQAIERALHEEAREPGAKFPAGLHQKIMAALEAEAAPATRRSAWLHSRTMRFAVATAASLLFIVALNWTLRTPQPTHALGRIESPLSIPTPSFDISALASDLLAAPKQDLRELTGSILSVTDGLFDLNQATPAPSPTPAS